MTVFDDTAVWLRQHPEDVNVLTKFLGSIENLPNISEQRVLFLNDTELWLAQHPNDRMVRTKYLASARRFDERLKSSKDAVQETRSRSIGTFGTALLKALRNAGKEPDAL